MTLGESSEDQLIGRITRNLPQRDNVLVGPGDDCAVITLEDGSLQLLKTDCVVESVHFLASADAERVGWKALARVVSDIAAMGGSPTACVVTLVLRADTSIDWLDQLYLGMQKCATAYDFSIVGGETSTAPAGSANLISVAATGSVSPENLILRSTANAGDCIYVTGKLGGSILGKHLDFTPRLTEAQWLATHCKPSAMMDLSDGLAKDLPRMALLSGLSGLSYAVDLAALPLSDGSTTQNAISDGEDYELLFSIPAEHSEKLEKSWPSHFPQLSRIGHFLPANEPSTPLMGGWEHFSSTPANSASSEK